MIRRPGFLFSILFCILGLSSLFAATPKAKPRPAPQPKPSTSAHFDDPAHLLPPDPAWFEAWDAKLANFEANSGIKILVQYHSKSPSEAEDKKPGAYMSALSKKLGTLQHGALVVYFADEDDWRVWVGDEIAPIFVGQPGTAKEFTDNGKMHKVKEAFLAAAHAKGEAAFAAAKKAAPADHPATPALRVKLLSDALLQDLMVKLGGK